jgi:ribonucleoside-triphosphate reductase
MPQASIRAQIVERRTYLRPLDEEGQLFETSEEAVLRQLRHQRWLWERAQGSILSRSQEGELDKLGDILRNLEGVLAGRTRWLGGTQTAMRREASQFNCSFVEVRTVHDLVDTFWLLLQGCGVGFRPIRGTLNGFVQPIPEIEVVRTQREDKGGYETNREYFNPKTSEWRITVGDSAESWAKVIGKLAAGKYPAKKLVFDLSQLRPAGSRLAGYGWLCSGDEMLADALPKIANIFNQRAGELLTRIDILDLVNLLGTVLSSRRSAQICLIPFLEDECIEFAQAKVDHWTPEVNKPWRAQSNNSILFYQEPSRKHLNKVFEQMIRDGGSEPGFYNAMTAVDRAPYFKGTNPCGEILLGDKSFCNLVEYDVSKFNGRWQELKAVVYYLARANYRQTCVNLRDGVLQDSWHQLNEYLRLCGVGPTGVLRWEHWRSPDHWRTLRFYAHLGANSMADELGMPRAKLVTTVKPSGTASKTLGSVEYGEVPEGAHKPLGKYIFNNVGFHKVDPMVDKLRSAGYHVFTNPYDPTGVLVTIPVSYEGIEFDKVTRTVTRGRWERTGRDQSDVEWTEYTEEVEVEVNLESAVAQLERYKLLMDNYVDHNCSITVSYSPEEAPEMVDWIIENWDSYCGVSFLFRNDPSKTAEDLGYPYLPQEVVDKETWEDYVAGLLPVDLEGTDSLEEVDSGSECASGGCPIR